MIRAGECAHEHVVYASELRRLEAIPAHRNSGDVGGVGKRQHAGLRELEHPGQRVCRLYDAETGRRQNVERVGGLLGAERGSQPSFDRGLFERGLSRREVVGFARRVDDRLFEIGSLAGRLGERVRRQPDGTECRAHASSREPNLSELLGDSADGPRHRGLKARDVGGELYCELVDLRGHASPFGVFANLRADGRAVVLLCQLQILPAPLCRIFVDHNSVVDFAHATECDFRFEHRAFAH